jgi:hypothetical protein
MNDPLPGANNALLVNPYRNLANSDARVPKGNDSVRSYLWGSAEFAMPCTRKPALHPAIPVL